MTLRWWNPVSWVAVPAVAIARAIRGLFPWSQDGRRTSLHVAVLGAGPALTVMTLWTMNEALGKRLFETFANLAYATAAGLLIVVTAIAVGTGLNIFAKAGKSGAEFKAGGEADDIAKAAHQVADAAQNEAGKIEEELDLTGADAAQLEDFRNEQMEEQK